MRSVLCLLFVLPGMLHAQEVDRKQLIELLRLPTQLSIETLLYEPYRGFFAFTFLVDDPIHLARIEQLKASCKLHVDDWKSIQELAMLLRLTKQDNQLKHQMALLASKIKAQLEKRPLLVNHRISLVHVLFELQQHEQAKWIAMALVDQYPDNADVWGAMGAITEQEQPSIALKAYAQAIKLQPREGYWHLAFATAHCYNYQRTVMDKKNVDPDALLTHRFLATSPQSSSSTKKVEETDKVLPSSFVPTLENVQKQQEVIQDRHKALFETAREQTRQAIKLFREHAPQSTMRIHAVMMDNYLSACILPTVHQSSTALLSHEATLQEISNIVALRPTDPGLQLTLFLLKYKQLLMQFQKEQPKEYFQFQTGQRSFKSLCSNGQWQELLSLMSLEKQLPTLGQELKAPSEHALARMYWCMEDLEQAGLHARKACALSPQTNSYWKTLCHLHSYQKKYQACYQLRDAWLKHHSTADNHYTLAVVCQKLNDWKAARKHITAGLALDKKHWRLRLADIIVDLKLDSSSENIRRVAKRSEILFEDSCRLQPDPSLLPIKEGYLAFITLFALNGEYDRAHWLLNYAFNLNERRGDPDLTRVLQLIGAVGLKPPSLEINK